MTKDDIAKVIADAVGNPSTGPVRDSIPTIAAAIHAALNPKPAVERRVITPNETR